MKVTLVPWDALAIAVRMKRLVKAEVERARHVATVNGLNRKLQRVSMVSMPTEWCHTQLLEPDCSISGLYATM